MVKGRDATDSHCVKSLTLKLQWSVQNTAWSAVTALSEGRLPTAWLRRFDPSLLLPPSLGICPHSWTCYLQELIARNQTKKKNMDTDFNKEPSSSVQ
jgi:hypothetical protein